LGRVEFYGILDIYRLQSLCWAGVGGWAPLSKVASKWILWGGRDEMPGCWIAGFLGLSAVVAQRSIKNCCTQTQHSGNVWGVDECEWVQNVGGAAFPGDGGAP